MISKSIFLSVEKIHSRIKGSGFRQLANDVLGQDFLLIGNYFGIAKVEVLVLVPFLYRKLMNKQGFDFEGLVNFFHCEIMEVLEVQRVVKTLIRKRLVSRRKSDFERDEYFSINDAVFQNLLNDKPPADTSSRSMNYVSFLEAYQELCDAYSDVRPVDLYYDDFKKEVEDLLVEFKEVAGVRYIDSLGLDFVGKRVLIEVSLKSIKKMHRTFSGGIDVGSIVEDSCASIGEYLRYEERIKNETHPLMKENVLRFSEEGFKMTSEMFLTDQAYLILFEKRTEYGGMSGMVGATLIAPETLKSENLFYNETAEKVLNDLESVAMPGKFESICRDLETQSLPAGLTILLYGGPGTGKTSWAYALAKRTGRKVFKVEVEQVMSPYVSQSETNLVRIFEHYNNIVRHEGPGHEPVFLLNEADGLLKRRLGIERNAVDQMSNTMVTLLLEKLEQFIGIFVATMNHPNFDEAFDRRFLFKLKLDSPDVPTRRKILSHVFTELDRSMLDHIADQFNLTGANITNIRRKFLTKQILTPGIQIKDYILELCKQEFILSSPGRNPIGFRRELER